ncbi:MAG TPA: phosphopantothenoylcysteine decarboxylase, partial [Propionibacteriaceae bacterium]|nr:phosphopantothenoylcysteine decarboxylase [Propionibacteriaceae bacterium]
DLAGRHVVVSAGGTHEHLYPVRYLGNSSSGLMGIALARAAGLRGASVTIVTAHVSAPLPNGAWLRVVPATSTADLADAMRDVAPTADVVIMAAAPADFTPVTVSAGKIKKDADAGLVLELRQTIDILASLSHDRARAGQVIVGFAAETASDPGRLLQLGREKLARKGCDLLVLNDVSGGAVFGDARNTVTILDADGIVAQASGDKNVIAHRILDAVVRTKEN